VDHSDPAEAIGQSQKDWFDDREKKN